MSQWRSVKNMTTESESSSRSSSDDIWSAYFPYQKLLESLFEKYSHVTKPWFALLLNFKFQKFKITKVGTLE